MKFNVNLEQPCVAHDPECERVRQQRPVGVAGALRRRFGVVNVVGVEAVASSSSRARRPVCTPAAPRARVHEQEKEGVARRVASRRIASRRSGAGVPRGRSAARC